MMFGRRVRARAFAVLLLLGGAAAGSSVYAVEPGPGSRNFTAPNSAPNYFSNESAPFQGGPSTRSVQPGADQFNAAPGRSVGATAAASRRYSRKAAASAARGKQRGKLARGKRASSRQLARAGAPKGGKAVLAGRAKSAPGKTAAPATRTAASHSKQAARSAR